MSDVELLKVCAVELHKRHPAIYAEMYFDAAERSKYYADRRQKIVQTITPDDSPQPPLPPSFVTSSRQPIHTAHVRAHVRSAVWRGSTSSSRRVCELPLCARTRWRACASGE
jgi:hypothetical protein